MTRTLLILLSTLCAFVTCRAAEPMTGAYAKASTTDKDVVAAARFAIRAESRVAPAADIRQPGRLALLKILRAERQVVAGVNYKLSLRVREGDTQKRVEAVVWWQSWRKPDPYELTSWKRFR